MTGWHDDQYDDYGYDDMDWQEAAVGCTVGVLVVMINIALILLIMAVFDLDWWWI